MKRYEKKFQNSQDGSDTTWEDSRQPWPWEKSISCMDRCCSCQILATCFKFLPWRAAATQIRAFCINEARTCPSENSHFFEFRVWLIRSLVIVMRIDAGMTFISNESVVFGCFPESVGHRMFSWDHYVCFEKILVPINPLSWASWACRSTIYRDAQSRLPLFLRLVGFELCLRYLSLQKLTS